MKKLKPYITRHNKYTTTISWLSPYCMAWHDCSPLLLLVAIFLKVLFPLLVLSTSYCKPVSFYGLTDSTQTCHGKTGQMLACYSNALLPDGLFLGHWTQKWPSKITCSLGNQWPRKWRNSKFPNCGIILTKIGPIICIHKFLLHFFRGFGGGGRLAA